MTSPLKILSVLCIVATITEAATRLRETLTENDVVEIVGQLPSERRQVLIVVRSPRDTLGIYLRALLGQLYMTYRRGRSRRPAVRKQTDAIGPGKNFRVVLRQKRDQLKLYLINEERESVFQHTYKFVASNVNLVTAVQNGRVKKSEWSHYSSFPQNCGQRLVQYSVAPTLCERTTNSQTRMRIVNGIQTQPGDHPWQVSIWRQDAVHEDQWHHICGGTLVAECLVVSAAHCFQQAWDVGKFQVRVGDFYNRDDRQKLFDEYESSQDIKIKKIITHPKYSLRKFAVNDIALVQLKPDASRRCARFGSFVQPACLPWSANQFLPSTSCIITGWGATQYGQALGEYPPCLQKAIVHLISNHQCKEDYPDLRPDGGGETIVQVPESVQCAAPGGDNSKPTDACQGDSGGPLICSTNNTAVLWGITSWGRECGQFYGIYTRLNKFMDWVETYVKPDWTFEPSE